MYLNPDAAHIDTCVKLVNSNKLASKDKLNVLNQCLQFGLHKEIKISIQPIKEWIESINPETLKTYQAEFENLGCNYLEYVLYYEIRRVKYGNSSGFYWQFKKWKMERSLWILEEPMIVSLQDVEYTDFIYWQETESFINGVASATGNVELFFDEKWIETLV